MEFIVLDTNFRQVAIVDTFESAIWTDRYNTYGDFQIILAANTDNIDIFRQDYYLYYGNSEHLMIIEAIEIKTSADGGSTMTVTGRSLESILDRRIVWKLAIVTGNMQDALLSLINQAFINPSDASRKIPGFSYKKSTDPFITAATIDTQYTGDNMYDVITNACKETDIGFRILSPADKQFVFEFYTGTDRSYGQTANPYVVFSPSYENLIDSDYYTDKKTYKTVTLIGGEGENSERKYDVKTVTGGSKSGLDRRELFTDARQIQSKDENNNDIPMTTYYAQLRQKGAEDLAKNSYHNTFDGEAEPTRMFVYGRDFVMGDIVQIMNEYGMVMETRVTEFIQSQSKESGVKAYPTFTAMSSI